MRVPKTLGRTRKQALATTTEVSLPKQLGFRVLLSFFFLPAVVLIFLDQLFKNLALTYLVPGTSVEVFGEILRLTLAYNNAAAFSIGFGQTWIFTIISSIAGLALIWLSRKIETRSWALMAGILLAGIVGNLIDRLTREPGFPNGHVIDYLQIPFNFPIFNFADICIVSMAILGALRVIRGEDIGKAAKAK